MYLVIAINLLSMVIESPYFDRGLDNVLKDDLDFSMKRLSTAWPAQLNSIRSGLPIHIDPMEKSVQTSLN